MEKESDRNELEDGETNIDPETQRQTAKRGRKWENFEKELQS